MCGKYSAKSACGIGILLLAADVAGIIVSPGPALPCPLVVLTGQLVLVIVGIGSGVGTVIDGFNIAVGIVGIGVGGIIPSCGIFQRGNLSAGLAGRRRPVGNGIGQNGGTAVLGYPAADPSEAIVGIALYGAAVSDGGDPVVIIIGIACSMGCAVNGLNQLGQVVQVIIGIAYAVTVPTAGLSILHQAVCEVVVVGGSPSGGRIGDRCQGAVCVTLHLILRRCSKIPQLIGSGQGRRGIRPLVLPT